MDRWNLAERMKRLANDSQSSPPRKFPKSGGEFISLAPISPDMEEVDKYILFSDVTVLDSFLQYSPEEEHYPVLKVYFEKPLKCMRAIIYRHKYSSPKDLKRMKAMFPPSQSLWTDFNDSDKEKIMKIFSKIFPEICEKTKEKIYSLAYRKDYYT